MSRHRADVPTTLRPRYGRMAVLAASLCTTGIAVLGGIGVLPSSADDGDDSGAALSADASNPAQPDDASSSQPIDDSSGKSSSKKFDAADSDSTDDSDDTEEQAQDVAVPADSGSGRRAIFSQSQQRVWLVDDKGGDDTMLRTYEVYSRSTDAVGVDDSGTMKYFVRFTQGPTGAAIGFHDIPIKDGEHTQSAAQLGTPQSHGCIRAQRPDAKAMWAFAQLGTTVVVTA